MAQTPLKDRRINIRTNQSEEELLKLAAERENLTLSEFMLTTALAQAEEILSVPQPTILSNDDFSNLLAILDEAELDPAINTDQWHEFLDQPAHELLKHPFSFPE